MKAPEAPAIREGEEALAQGEAEAPVEEEEKAKAPALANTALAATIDKMLVGAINSRTIEKVTLAEIQDTGISMNLLVAIDFYFPKLPFDHPLAGIGLSGIALFVLIQEKGLKTGPVKKAVPKPEEVKAPEAPKPGLAERETPKEPSYSELENAGKERESVLPR